MSIYAGRLAILAFFAIFFGQETPNIHGFTLIKPQNRLINNCNADGCATGNNDLRYLAPFRN